MHFRSCILLLALLLSVPLFAAEGGNKSAYRDQLYLGNIWYGSRNPVSISHMPLRSVADIRLGYDYADGELKRIDQPTRSQWWQGELYGIKQLKKIAFEGSISYRNGAEDERRWNSALFISPDNPFIAGDSIRSDFSLELFHLNGGFSYAITPRMHVGLRAVYDVGSSANQTDPRPDTKGMRFRLNPGIDYRWGAFTAGLSAHTGWLSESMSSTVVKTTVNHFIFIFQGMGVYETKSASGFYRKYTGFDYGLNLQLAYDKQGDLANFLEIGYDNATEEAIDGSGNGRYKGGKYDADGYSLTERLEIRAGRTRHNISLSANLKDTEGTWYIQQQVADGDGNISWEVKHRSVNHTEKRQSAGIAYRIDRLKTDRFRRVRHRRIPTDGRPNLIPYFTGRIEGGFVQSETKHQPEGWNQKYTAAVVNLALTKRFDIRKTLFEVNLKGGYRVNLSDSYHFEGIKLEDKYTQPYFEGLTAGYFTVQAEAAATVPFRIKGMTLWLKPFAGYRYQRYTGDADILQGSSLNGANAGLSLLF